MESPRPAPPFSLREFGDLVSAALDPPSSVSPQSSSPSPSSSPFPASANSNSNSNSTSAFNIPFSASVSDSNTQKPQRKEERENRSQRGIVHTMLTRFKRRASEFVGSGSVSGSSSSLTRPPSPSPYRIPDLRMSAHVASDESVFVPFVPPVVQYERERAALSSPNFNFNLRLSTSNKAHPISCAPTSTPALASTPSLPSSSLNTEEEGGAEYMYAHAHGASGASFPPAASSPSWPTASVSSCSPAASPTSSVDSCSTAASSTFPPTPTTLIFPSVSEEHPRVRRWSARSSSSAPESGIELEDEDLSLNNINKAEKFEKLPRSSPCTPITRRRLASTASLFAQHNPHPAPVCALPPVPLSRRNAPLPPLPPLPPRVEIQNEAQVKATRAQTNPSPQPTPTHSPPRSSPRRCWTRFPSHLPPPQHCGR
ncbi:hypothetical protein C8R43DRAFT_210654 [Mycena crocata]|nr:hypothetical protein C8R43DRAFT_210654 [Mycena crocata]